MSTTPFTEPPSGPRPRQRPSSASKRPRIIVASALAVVALVGLVILFSGSSEETAGPPPSVTNAASGEPTVEYVDGTLTVVEEGRLVLQPFDTAEPEMEFVIREDDLPNFDIAHMQSHSAVALPTRIYYEEDGDTLVARYKEDAPANSQQQDGA